MKNFNYYSLVIFLVINPNRITKLFYFWDYCSNIHNCILYCCLLQLAVCKSCSVCNYLISYYYSVMARSKTFTKHTAAGQSWGESVVSPSNRGQEEKNEWPWLLLKVQVTVIPLFFHRKVLSCLLSPLLSQLLNAPTSIFQWKWPVS